MVYKIQATTANDLPILLKLNAAAVPAVNYLRYEEIRNLFVQAVYFQCLWREDDVIGFLIALAPGASYDSPNYRWFESKYDEFIYVDRIVIHPSQQRVGLGRHFYDNLKKFVACRFPLITCEVNLRPRNESSLQFHKKYGFRQVGTQETENGGKEVSLLEYKIS